jgi:hypothetical protein
MAEEQQTQTDATEQASATASAGTKNADNQSQEHMIPKHRYDEVSNRLKALEDERAVEKQAREEEDSKKLAEQAEWQKLAENRKVKLDELKPKADLADKLTVLMQEQYDAEIAEWPETVKAMAPNADADILAKLEWMKKAKPLARELAEEKTPAYGNGRRPPPVSSANSAKAAEAQRTTWIKQARARYR